MMADAADEVFQLLRVFDSDHMDSAQVPGEIGRFLQRRGFSSGRSSA